jgi:hypothetical protein
MVKMTQVRDLHTGLFSPARDLHDLRATCVAYLRCLVFQLRGRVDLRGSTDANVSYERRCSPACTSDVWQRAGRLCVTTVLQACA